MQFAQGSVGGYLVGIALIFASVASFVTSYYATRKLTQLHMKIMSEYTASKDEASLRAAFERMDVDHSGALEKEELAVLAKQLGIKLHPGELVAIFDVLDADSNGKISFEEFQAWWTGRKGDYVTAWV